MARLLASSERKGEGGGLSSFNWERTMALASMIEEM